MSPLCPKCDSLFDRWGCKNCGFRLEKRKAQGKQRPVRKTHRGNMLTPDAAERLKKELGLK